VIQSPSTLLQCGHNACHRLTVNPTPGCPISPERWCCLLMLMLMLPLQCMELLKLYGEVKYFRLMIDRNSGNSRVSSTRIRLQLQELETAWPLASLFCWPVVIMQLTTPSVKCL